MSKELYKHKKPDLCTECSLRKSTTREVKEKMRDSDTGKEVQSKEFMRQCSCGENSLSISPSPEQVFLRENPFAFSGPPVTSRSQATWVMLAHGMILSPQRLFS